MSTIQIIPIGSCCDITFKLKRTNFRNKTGLFEWHFTFNFKDVLKVFKMLAYNEELSYSRRDEWNFCIDGTEIYSSHYKILDEYKDIMNRRKDRLFEYIKGVDKLLFMRQITDNGVSVFPTAEDIEELKGYIYKINPNCNFNILFVVYTDKKMDLPDGVKYLFLRNSEKENMKLWVDKINEF